MKYYLQTMYHNVVFFQVADSPVNFTHNKNYDQISYSFFLQEFENTELISIYSNSKMSNTSKKSCKKNMVEWKTSSRTRSKDLEEENRHLKKTYAEERVAVGMQVTLHPPRRSQRALLTHWAPLSCVWRQSDAKVVGCMIRTRGTYRFNMILNLPQFILRRWLRRQSERSHNHSTR